MDWIVIGILCKQKYIPIFLVTVVGDLYPVGKISKKSLWGSLFLVYVAWNRTKNKLLHSDFSHWEDSSSHYIIIQKIRQTEI